VIHASIQTQTFTHTDAYKVAYEYSAPGTNSNTPTGVKQVNFHARLLLARKHSPPAEVVVEERRQLDI